MPWEKDRTYMSMIIFRSQVDGKIMRCNETVK